MELLKERNYLTDGGNKMVKKKIIWLVDVVIAMAVVAVLSGCASISSDINVSRNAGLKDKSFEIEAVAVDHKNYHLLKNTTFDEYWEAGSDIRTSLNVHDFCFGPKSIPDQTLSSDNPIWEKWQNQDAGHLFIMCNLPLNDRNNSNWKLAVPAREYSFFNFWSDRSYYFVVDSKGIKDVPTKSLWDRMF